VLFQVLLEVFEGLRVGVQAFFLGVCNKDHAIHTTQDQFAAGVVEDLSGNRIEVETRAKPAHRTQIQGQEVEKQGTVGLGGEGDHLAFLLVRGPVKNELQICRLTAQAGAVIHDFAVNFAGRKIDEAQDSPRSFGWSGRGSRARGFPSSCLAGTVLISQCQLETWIVHGPALLPEPGECRRITEVLTSALL